MTGQRHPGLFDVDEPAGKLTVLGDPLVKLKAEIDFEASRADLKRVHQKDRTSKAGATPFDEVLILQHRYTLRTTASNTHDETG